jgi:hypothetical protein
MDISYLVFWVGFFDGGRAGWRASLNSYPVNVIEACQSAMQRKAPAPHAKCPAWQFPEQSLCFGINRAAQNGSRSPLKMLTFAAMRCIWPCGDAVGFPLSAGLV